MMTPKLSSFWMRIQGSLFPKLERAFDHPLTEEHKKVARTLEILRVEETIKQPVQWTGRPAQEWAVLCRAFVAKSVLGLPTTRSLIDRLKSDETLARMCGWKNASKVPHESTFSRVFAQLVRLNMAERIHGAVVETHLGSELVEHASMDGSAIKGRERALGKAPKVKAPPKKRGRKKKGEKTPVIEAAPVEQPALSRYVRMRPGRMLKALPQGCDWGSKKNSQGKVETWKGFKIHVLSADGEIPLACVLTSASVHDSQAAPYLLKRARERTTFLYALADAAYDAKAIKDLVCRQGGVPIMDANPRRGKTKIPMDPDRERRYRNRSGAERIFSRLKDEFGATMIRVRGHRKVGTHLMFAVLALTADQLLRLGSA